MTTKIGIWCEPASILAAESGQWFCDHNTTDRTEFATHEEAATAAFALNWEDRDTHYTVREWNVEQREAELRDLKREEATPHHRA
jgi:hypothetical protein